MLMPRPVENPPREVEKPRERTELIFVPGVAARRAEIELRADNVGARRYSACVGVRRAGACWVAVAVAVPPPENPDAGAPP